MVPEVTKTLSFLMTTLIATAAIAAQSAAPVSEPITLTTPTGSIEGTLLMPAASGRVPVVLIVAGSGPTDRDGNTPLLPGRNDSLKLLAEALAAEGIGSLRFDKRGIAASRAAGAREVDLRFETYVDDAAAWVGRLRGDARVSRVIIAGHSEGSLIGMMAARKANADAFISIAGPSERASDGLRRQMRPQLGAATELWNANEEVLKAFEAGNTVEPLPAVIQSVPPLAQLYRSSVQPYLISWMRYTPSTEFAALAMPALIVQGTTDIQVRVDDAKALAAAKPDAVVAIVEGMNHVLKAAPADAAQNIATYSNPSLPIVPEARAAIIAFVGRVSAR